MREEERTHPDDYVEIYFARYMEAYSTSLGIRSPYAYNSRRYAMDIGRNYIVFIESRKSPYTP